MSGKNTPSAGKGSKRRPQQISDDELARRWAMAFGKREPLTECRCSLRVKLLGDGCQFCNPEYAAQFSEEEE